MYYRLVNSGVGFERPNRSTVYHMLSHEQQTKNEDRVKILYEGISLYEKDGLNNVKYKLVEIVKYKLFTHIKIDNRNITNNTDTS